VTDLPNADAAYLRLVIEQWRFMGMTNVSFVEYFLERIVAGGTEQLLKELE
jgi:hypothetical protein